MDKYDIQKLRELPIESVAERLGLRVDRHKALCPFHEDSHPSLTFHRATNTYKCFVCGEHGNSISMAMRLLNVPFVEACKWLANEHNMILTERQPVKKMPKVYPPDVNYLSRFFRHPILNAEAQRFLFEERKIDPRVVHWLGITSISLPTPCWRYGKPYYDAPSLLFPYRDADGKLQNVQSRYLGKEAGIPRFRFPPGGECHIFGLQILKFLKSGEPLYISEGITDCMALMSAGHKTIAIPSATLLKEEDLKSLAIWNSEHGTQLELRIYPDQDRAGELLYRQLAYIAPKIGCILTRETLPEGFKDFGQYWASQITSH